VEKDQSVSSSEFGTRSKFARGARRGRKTAAGPVQLSNVLVRGTEPLDWNAWWASVILKYGVEAEGLWFYTKNSSSIDASVVI
jgi:hypothetical protein